MNKATIQKLLDIMSALRDPESGCPWDLEQDFATVAPYTIEEAYEVADAIERNDLDALRDELGDLLLQVVFHAQIAVEQGVFGFDDVVDAICTKLIRRHPHVFGDEEAGDSDAQRIAWEAHKRAERGEAGVLDGVASALPALQRAEKLGRRASGVGFDWPDVSGVRAKVDEELAEFDAAVASAESDAMTDEIGDLMFAVAQLARHHGIDPETALRAANGKFERRFRHVEAGLRDTGTAWSSQSAAEFEARWQMAKRES